MDTRSPATPSTPYGQPSQYKVNVNRQKTRKWVEAKTQNYDGDDWGGVDDEFDDDDAHDPGSAGPPRFVRPSDIYKRMEEEKEKERSEDGGDATDGRRRQSFGRNDEGDASRSLRPLDTVAERKSEYGFDGLMINPAEPAPPNPEASDQNQDQNQPEPWIASQPQPPALHQPQATTATQTAAEPVKRYSTSPKLPLLSRLSGFGGDFFSGGMGFTSDPPKSPEPPADSSPTPTGGTFDDGQPSSQQQSFAPRQEKPSRPSFPGAWVSETATTPGDMATPGSNTAANPGDVPSITERPTARDDSTQDSLPEQDTRDKAQARRDLTPIAPLQPRKGSSVEEPAARPSNPITRVDTVSTADNASPLKESDVLRDEIMRSLSPVRPSDGHIDPPRDESAARESAYLSDVYGDYWSGEDKPPEVETPLNQSGLRQHESASAATDEAADATPRAPAQASFDHVTTDAVPPAIPAVEPEAVTSEPRRERFSWEAGSTPGGGSSAQASPTKQPTTESPESLTSPVAAARHEDPTSPGSDGRGSSLLSLPAVNFDSDISPQVASAISTLSPGQDPLSPPPDEGANKHLYPTGDKMLLQSPMSPMSPMEPIPITDDEEPQRTTSPPPHEPPEGVPLPRSPSPTQAGPSGGGIDDTRRQSQTAYNMMSLKQVLQLPTSPDRVQKMQEMREHLAVLETGLASWLADMAAQPAHENAMASYGYALSGDDAELWGTKGGAVRIPLNAPAPGAEGAGEDGGGGGGVGRTPSTSLNMGNLVMHSGQAGAKGKELLQSAGKMGKGLLSKGKNKLRERAESKRA
ncbi:hypothetical protein UCDDA912_g04789 [Diaporthe ampelina]|uniref:Uncharacterized protein n=1 Tax=Diaporthe ampelina TaxID=1214573 RepID=A0A0G2FML4_9PEZI|nr:hypothetical protein UCDDA912_g04789 [Diaporthe ampelina]